MLKETAAEILIVDDSASNNVLLSETLSRIGHHIQVAYDGSEAWELLQTHHFDLVLLDIMLPEISGLDLLVQIRQVYDMQQLPVILISALGDSDDFIQGLEQGANDYMTKPLSLKQVRARVHTQLHLKQLADERRRTLMALQHTNHVKNRLMRIATHDLRNPISNISVALKLMALPSTDEDRKRALLESALGMLAHMDEIIDSFLNVGILQDEELTVQFGAVRVDQCIADVYDSFFQVAMQKRVYINVDVQPIEVVADYNRLKQVLTNLISNAIKYTPPDSTVTLTDKVGADHYTLFVRDEGEGIPQNETHMLFKPFSKLSNLPTNGEPSTGLGLWIVKQMMEVQNGSVGCNSDYQHGAEFWIRLPRVESDIELNPCIKVSKECVAG